ncbi:lysophospholipase catalytic domain-containing protein [Lipomyces japonicus]|uniref:lysophospholipase catalytic domain-containing protein n=1 Tax=Lipomyces japonicus TaxID=56871 RepID=UPI0034CED5E6
MKCLSTTYLALCATAALCVSAEARQNVPVHDRLPESQEAIDALLYRMVDDPHDQAEIVARTEQYFAKFAARNAALANTLQRRSFVSANYTPQEAACPTYDLVRQATELSTNETAYISGRQAAAKDALINLLDRVNLDGFDPTEFLSNSTINIGLAFSGGGYRAMLNGAGFLAAADVRTPGATDEGHIGGLLQASSYIVGLSGGNWLVGSVVLNNFSSVVDLQADPVLWDLQNSLLAPKGTNVSLNERYYDNLVDQTSGKADAGFPISLTDYWGQLLGQQLFNYTDGGSGLAFSDILWTPAFLNFDVPYPIVLSVDVLKGQTASFYNSTVYEVSPYEFGSWDDTLNSFAVTKYLGSPVNDGKAKNCVVGFDNAGFVVGTSSSLFNVAPLNLVAVQDSLVPVALLDSLEDYNSTRDFAAYGPNPFAGVPDAYVKDDEYVSLADGGEDGQNVPLLPLLEPSRQVDVIFALDNSRDTDQGWPDGSSLIYTYNRQFHRNNGTQKMAEVPSYNTFVGAGLTKQPTFFGCNDTDSPLIVYLANHPYSYLTNTSTLKLSYTSDEVASFIQNGYNLGTQGNGTLQEDWPQCLACALIHREVQRQGTDVLAQCQSCFSQHCWNGTTVDSPGAEYATPTVEITASATRSKPATTSHVATSSFLANSSATGSVTTAAAAAATSARAVASGNASSTITNTPAVASQSTNAAISSTSFMSLSAVVLASFLCMLINSMF